MDYCYITRRPVHKEIDFYVEEDHTKLSYITNYAFVSPDSVMIHMEDVTEKKNIETKLKNNEEKYRALFNTSTDAIILFDLDGKIIDCNNAEPISLYQHEELIGITVNQLFDSKQNTSLDTRIITNAEEFVLQFIAQSSIDGFIEIACKKKDNSLFLPKFKLNISPLKDKLFCFMRDISERKKLEDELKESSARLQIAFEAYLLTSGLSIMSLEYLCRVIDQRVMGNILDKTLYEVDLQMR